MEFWQEALKVGGVATVGAFLFYKLAKDVLHLSWLDELSARQKFTFIIVFIIAIVYVSDRLIEASSQKATSVTMDKETGQFIVDSHSLNPKAKSSVLRQVISYDLYRLGNLLLQKGRLKEAVIILRSSEKLSGKERFITLKRIKAQVELYKAKGLVEESIAQTLWEEATEIIELKVVATEEEDLKLSIQILELALGFSPKVSQISAQIEATLSFNRTELEYKLLNSEGEKRAFDAVLQSADKQFTKGNYVDAISKYAVIGRTSDDNYLFNQLNKAIELYSASFRN